MTNIIAIISVITGFLLAVIRDDLYALVGIQLIGIGLWGVIAKWVMANNRYNGPNDGLKRLTIAIAYLAFVVMPFVHTGCAYWCIFPAKTAW